MKFEDSVKNALNSGINFLNNSRHYCWTPENINTPEEDSDPFERIKDIEKLEGNHDFKTEVTEFRIRLRELQNLLKESGYKPSIMRIGELYDQTAADGQTSFVFGLMFPTSNVRSAGFASHFNSILPDYFLGQDTLYSSVEACLSAAGAAIMTIDERYHVSDSTDFVLMIVYVGPRPQEEVDKIDKHQHININPAILDAITRELNHAYDSLEQGIISDLGKDDAAGAEA